MKLGSSEAPRITWVTLSTLVLGSILLLNASFAIRSEARGRDRGDVRTSHGYDTESKFSYAVVGNGSNTISIHDGPDWEVLKRRLEKYGDEVLWFSLRGHDYVVVDRATITRARDLLEPIETLGLEQGRLGAEQSRIGAKQSAIGAKQSVIGARQAALSIRLARLALEDAAEPERRDLEDRLDELSRRMEALSRDMEPLARRQEELGRRQSGLGQRMERLSKEATSAIERLAEDAVEDGTAEAVD